MAQLHGPDGSTKEVLLTKKAIELLPRQRELFTLRNFYSTDDWREQDLLFLSQAIVYSCLPYRKTDDREFSRVFRGRNGVGKITISATREGVALPYGKDRVILACALTKARQKGRPMITYDELEPLLCEFGENYRSYGGADYNRIRERFDRLNHCSITIERDGGSASKRGMNSFIISRYNLPNRQRGPRRPPANSTFLEPAALSYETLAIQFGAEFWEDYLQYSIPMPVPLLKLFADEPRGWDTASVVHWSSYSALKSQQSGGSGTKLFGFSDVRMLLGATESNPTRLRLRISEYLAEIRTIWPEVNAAFNRRGDLVISAPRDGKMLVQESSK